jgi:glycine/betaine/sarcosine/D-proline reductase family selenoprotein B
METKLKIMHYINQFFAGIGGEDKASTPLGFAEGALGPGIPLQNLIAEKAKIVMTAYCGDNYFPDHKEAVTQDINRKARENGVDLLVAGPAFFSGRHGFACVEVCNSFSNSLGMNSITGLAASSPAITIYKRYKNRRVYAFPTAENVAGMKDALDKIAKGVVKCGSRGAMGPAAEEGYIPRGLRVLETMEKSAVERAIEMLKMRISGSPFTSEFTLEEVEETPIAQPVSNMSDTVIALASTGGLHVLGNPHGAVSLKNTVWAKYPIGALRSMKQEKWIVVHAGISNVYIAENPNYLVPLDVARELEDRKTFAKLSPNFYSTTGVGGAIEEMERIGNEMAKSMKEEGVGAALLTST